MSEKPNIPDGAESACITVTITEHAAIVHIAMPSIRDRQAQVLQDRLSGVADHAHGRVIVSLAEVVDITSACINALVAVSQRCRAAGGALVVYGLSRELERLFRITRLDRLVTIARHAEEAHAHFTGESGDSGRAWKGSREAA